MRNVIPSNLMFSILVVVGGIAGNGMVEPQKRAGLWTNELSGMANLSPSHGDAWSDHFTV